MSALYQITDQHRELLQLAEEADLDPQMLADTLDGLAGDFEAKAKSVAMFIENLQVNADSIQVAAKLMTQRAQRLAQRAEAIRTYLKINMEATGITKISCPWFVISLRKNPPRVEIIDESLIPEQYRVWPEPPPPSIDKRALLEALKIDPAIPGATIAQDTRVEIKL